MIELEEDDNFRVPETMDYFYLLDYENGVGMNLDDQIKMYLIADKYDVPGLKELALEKFKAAAKADCDWAYRILMAIELIYEKTVTSYQDLRSAALDAWLCGDRMPEDNDDRVELSMRLQGVPEFTAELAIHYVQSYPSQGKE